MSSPAKMHLIKQWPCGGGMGSVLKLHIEQGDTVIAVSGRPGPGVRCLGLSPNTTIRAARASITEAVSTVTDSPHSILHYNGYGIDWFSGNHRLGAHQLCLHSDYPARTGWLRTLVPYAEGGYCVSAPLARWINKEFALHGNNAVKELPVPVEAPAGWPGPPTKPEPLVIGYAGRIEQQQKRLDRLPEFLRDLEQAGFSYQMELLGEGPYLGQLQRRLSGNSRVRYLGHLQGDAYWDVLRRWNYMLFLSDYEGHPIAMMEGLLAGVIPLYPDFHDKQDELSGWGLPLYRRGDMAGAVNLLAELEQDWTEDARQHFLEKASNAVKARSRSAYFSAFDGFIESDISAPARIPDHAGFPEFLPLWIYHRWIRLRQHRWRAILSLN